MIEFRSAPALIAPEASGPPRIEGIAAPFNSLSTNLGGFREKIAPGAFARSLRESDVLALHHHSVAQVLGRTSNGSLSLHEDATGLRFSLTLPDTSLGRDIAALVRLRTLAAMSFAFTVRGEAGEEWEEVGGRIIRTLIDVRLVEISTVANPAYPSTSVAMAQRCATPAIEAAAARARAKMLARGMAVA